MKTREECLALLHEFTQSESLRKHAYSVEACVKSYAEKFGEDTLFWGNVALLHDFDYEKYPDLEHHPIEGSKILRERGFNEVFIRAILSHADHTGVTRESLLEKTLFACDELAGFLTAVAYVKPSKSMAEVEVKSVLKKMKDKAFARAVSREDITMGAAGLGVEKEEHIAFCIEALKKLERE